MSDRTLPCDEEEMYSPSSDVPCVMASPVSAVSFSSLSSCTQDAAAICAKAEAQLAATPDGPNTHTHGYLLKNCEHAHRM